MAEDKGKTAVTEPATETASKEHHAAVEGAQSVAAAVSKVADAAVAEIRKMPPTSGSDREFDFSGNPGGRFTARGPGLFGPSGTIHIGGRQLKTLSWSTNEITGEMPGDVQSGEVVVHVDDKTKRKSYYRRA